MLLAAARAWALLAGRPMVLPEDVQAVFPSVAGHRLAGGARAGALQAQALLRAVRAAVATAAACRAARPPPRRATLLDRACRQRLFRARAGGRPAGRPAPPPDLHPADAARAGR